MDLIDLNENTIKRSEGLSDSIKQFNELSDKIDTFLTYDSNKCENFIDLTKKLFDFNKQLIKQSISKDSNILSLKSSLDELYTNGFDEEQVWQQIQLNNEPILDLLVREVATVSVEGSYFTPTVQEVEEEEEIEFNIYQKKSKKTDKSLKITEELISEDESDDQDSLDEEEEVEEVKKIPKKVRIIEPKRKSIVDDKFFKLHELENFLNKEDLREERKISGEQEVMSEESDEDIDYFEDTNEMSDDEEEDDGKDAMFGDFFDSPIDQTVEQKSDELSDKESEEEINDEIDTRDVDINDMEDNEENNKNGFDFDNYSSDESDEQFSNKRKDEVLDQNKSEFERSKEALNEKISKQERLNLMTKSWQMSGEIVADKRPENSLLEEHLHFDHTTRPAPLITEETTVKVEDIIRQRIKDNAFDDVVRKVKPKEKPFEYKRRITMESEKSKQSLAQIYENEYIKQNQKESETQQNPIHTQIQRLMRNLFVRLDALSNFNFTPRAPQPEVKIINNLPAITAEEVTPMTVSEVSLLAPQEVFDNQKRELQTNAEKTETDRKRSRRVKKKIQSKKAKYNESKGIKSKNTEKESNKNWSETKHLSSSKKFFEKLHEKNTEVINKKKFEKKVSAKQSNKMKL